MEQLPDFWRIEIFHPLSVHFPIGILITGFLFKIISLKYKREVWTEGSLILLLLGTAGLWIAVYTGELADGIVSRKLCDPTVLKDHQNMAYICAWIFTSASILESIVRFITTNLRIKSILLFWLSTILISCGIVVLGYVGHLGATLVYQQGAGTYQPSADCFEFVD